MKVAERHTIEERAARFQRRYTGPWQTVVHEVGPVDVTMRYRRSTRIEWLELGVAGHDLWVHAIARGLILPVLRRLNTWLEGSREGR